MSWLLDPDMLGGCCRSMAAAAQQRPGKRTVLGTVQPGESLSVPYGWRSAGKQLQVSGAPCPGCSGVLLGCASAAGRCFGSSHAAWHVKCLRLQATCLLLPAGQMLFASCASDYDLSLFIL